MLMGCDRHGQWPSAMRGDAARCRDGSLGYADGLRLHGVTHSSFVPRSKRNFAGETSLRRYRFAKKGEVRLKISKTPPNQMRQNNK